MSFSLVAAGSDATSAQKCWRETHPSRRRVLVAREHPPTATHGENREGRQQRRSPAVLARCVIDRAREWCASDGTTSFVEISWRPKWQLRRLAPRQRSVKRTTTAVTMRRPLNQVTQSAHGNART